MKKIYLIISCIACLSLSGKAQLSLHHNHQILAPYAINPAFAGLSEETVLYTGIRKQWSGIMNAPLQNNLLLYGKAGKSIGMGANIQLKQSEVFNEFSASLSYAYHVKLNKLHSLSFSVSAYLMQDYLATDRIIADQQYDPVLSTYENQINFNAGASILYQYNGFDIGLAIPFLMNKMYSGTNETDPPGYDLSGNYIVHSSYLMHLSHLLEIRPMFTGMITNYYNFFFNAGTQVIIHDKYWISALYKTENVMGAGLGIKLSKHASFNYLYEWSGNGILQYSDGTHEFGLAVRFFPAPKIPEGIKHEQDTSAIVQKSPEKKEIIDSYQPVKLNTNTKIEGIQQKLRSLESQMDEIKQTYSGSELEKNKEKIETKIYETQNELYTLGGDYQFMVIIEAFKSLENARRSIDLWKERGIKAYIAHNRERGFYYIFTNHYEAYDQASWKRQELIDLGMNEFSKGNIWILINLK